jgi:hypothetical protein
MAAVHSIEGLIKWVRRDEWRGAFEDVFQRHVGQACRGAGIELDELAEIVGDHGVSNLLGLRVRGFRVAVRTGRAQRRRRLSGTPPRWKESAGTRAYVEALRRSTMSLYEVSDIVVGESFWRGT